MDARVSLLYIDDPLYTDYQENLPISDLNIDQILDAVTEDLDEYRLREIYRHKPLLLNDVEYRQAVARDLLAEDFRAAIEKTLALISRAKRYAGMRDSAEEGVIADKWHLDCAGAYCAAMGALPEAMRLPYRAQGWQRLFAWANGYAASDSFQALKAETSALLVAFDAYRFRISADLGNELLILDDDADESDVFADYRDVFARFDLNSVGQEIRAFADIRMNSLENGMLSLLIGENPSLFSSLHAFRERFGEFIHENTLTFERHAWFYLSYLRHMRAMEDKGFPFAFPVLEKEGGLSVRDGYDLSLAQMERTKSIVYNSLDLQKDERIMILTGPNQGGKTTFTRMLGQILFFACAGLPVPAAGARLPFVDDIRTHFAREEEAGSQSGRLQEELTRLRPMLRGVRGNSVLLIN